MPLRGNTDPSAQRGPAQRAGARQLYRIHCPGAPRATRRDGFPPPPQGRRPGQQAYSCPVGPEARAPTPRSPTEAVLCAACRASPGKAPAVPTLGGPGRVHTAAPGRRAGRGFPRPHTAPEGRPAHFPVVGQAEGPRQEAEEGLPDGKEFQRPISGMCRGPRPRGEALAGRASPRSTLSSQL